MFAIDQAPGQCRCLLDEIRWRSHIFALDFSPSSAFTGCRTEQKDTGIPAAVGSRNQ